MLHLPMEPVEYPDINPGSCALLTSMSPDRLIRQSIWKSYSWMIIQRIIPWS